MDKVGPGQTRLEGRNSIPPLTRCRRCGRRLSSPQSLRRALGPDCQGKTGTRRSQAYNHIDQILSWLRNPPDHPDTDFVTKMTLEVHEALEAGQRLTPGRQKTLELCRRIMDRHD